MPWKQTGSFSDASVVAAADAAAVDRHGHAPAEGAAEPCLVAPGRRQGDRRARAAVADGLRMGNKCSERPGERYAITFYCYAVNGADLASILGNWGDAPRVPFPPSDCPLNLINP